MGYPHPEFSNGALPSPHPVNASRHSEERAKPRRGIFRAAWGMSPRADGGGRAARSVPIAHAATRIASIVLAMLLAAAMLPAAGLQVAYADEPVERPATSGGDVALEGTKGDAGETADADAASQLPVAEERADGMLAADGLMYTVADGGLALVGFDGDAPEGALVVPAAVMLDGKETPVVAVDIAEGQTADKVVALSLPQSVKDINTASLASAFPALLSVEVAGTPSTLPVAAGAASVRAAYSTSGGMIFRPTSVTLQAEDGSIESIECKELVWAPPALVSARIPVECRAIAEGAFADVRELKTVVAFGTMERIADGAFSTEQMEAAKVVVPQASAAVTDDERVSASMALMGDAGQKERRSAWHEAGWRTDDIVMGKPYGSLTETVAVTDEGKIERDELQLVSYPGAHERAMDLKKPNADGIVEQAESGLAFTVKSDMTVAVIWQGDKTATPAHVDIPASVSIDDVTYPVTEIAPRAFEGAAFLQSVTIPEAVTAIGQDAFRDCSNLVELQFPFTLGKMGDTTSVEMWVSSSEEAVTNRPTTSRTSVESSVSTEEDDADAGESASRPYDDVISPYLSTTKHMVLYVYPNMANQLVNSEVKDMRTGTDGTTSLTITYVGDTEKIYWGGYVRDDGLLVVTANNAVGGGVGIISFLPPAGWKFASIDGERKTSTPVDTGHSDIFGVTLVRDEAMGSSELLTEDAALATYAKVSDLSSYVTTSALDGRNYITKAVSDLDNFYDKAKFNTISYEGLDEADYAGALPTFYVNDAAKLPKVPEPRREGHEFLGWTWSGQATPTKDVGAAFSGGGAVTLVANWDETEPETPEAKHFFTSDAPLRHDDASATQAHVIKVRLSSSPGTLASVSFEGDDRTGLLKETSGVKLFVGASEDALSSGTELSWGGATASGWECELARFSGGSYGVYVGVSVPTSAIDEASIPVSYADGSYVASLVKMNYAFA